MKKYKLSEEASETALKLRLSPDDVFEMCKLSAPFRHPHFNRRFERYRLLVDTEEDPNLVLRIFRGPEILERRQKPSEPCLDLPISVAKDMEQVARIAARSKSEYGHASAKAVINRVLDWLTEQDVA